MADSDDSKHLYSTVDRSSLSNPSEAVSTNIKLEWDIDFDKQTITGSAEHIVKVVADGATHVDFDSAKINIIGEVLVNGEKGTYTAAPAHEVLGTKLSVDIPAELRTEGTHFTVLFNYSINTDASAMQWLPASATKGLKYPYLFTQSQAIHARSLMPCQDSPGIKTQYTARVTAPKWCTVLMSALADTDKTTEGEKNVFVWKQPNPTPAYLVALAAGNLESREISHRVRVWAEPEVVESALFEFSETEDFVQAAEELTGCEYQWGRYDILCLPPSFPYGGMENPCLTFATPTLLAGDKSLADVIAHEIAHSWTGNLVTNHTWDHFWLNEGWTVWLERKITSKVRNNEEFGRLSSQVGWKHLQDDVKLLGEANPFTALTWKLAFGEDPDNAYSGVPYEKGCNLLMYLEEVVGTELFSQFVFSYIDTFKFSTVTTGAFRDHFVGFFDKLATAEAESNKDSTPSKASGGGKKNKKNKAAAAAANTTNTTKEEASNAAANAVQAIKGLDWNSLFYSTGLPSDVTSFSNSLSKAAEELARKWIALAATYKTDAPPAGCTAADLEGWSTMQRNVFLETLQNYTKKSLSHPSDVFTVAFLELMDRTYSFGASKNAEIMLRWQTLCLESEAQWIVDPVVDFITSQGRMKFARPLYRLLRASTIGKQIAIDTFEAKKDIYHPIARKMIAADLRRAAEAEEKEAIESQLEAEEELAAAKPVSAPVVTEVEVEVVEEAAPAPASAPVEVAEVASLRSTPEASGKTLQDQTPPLIGSPERSHTPDFSTPAATPSATPAKASTPAVAVATPEPTPVKEPTPVATPAKEEPAPLKEIIPTPYKNGASSAAATPAPTPIKEAEAPAAAATPLKEIIPTPYKAAALAAIAKEPTPVKEAPVAAPVAVKEATPAKAAAPAVAQKEEKVKAAPAAKSAAPAPVAAKAQPAAAAAPAKAKAAATSQEVSTFSWSGVSIFALFGLSALSVGAYWFTKRYRR